MGMRDLMWGVVVLLLVPFIVNQLSNRLDFSWTPWAALVAAVIGLGMLITSDTVTQRLWTDIARRHRLLTIIAAGLITGLLGAAGAALLTKGSVALFAWNFDESDAYFLGLVGGVGDRTWVKSFQANGQNSSDRSLRRISGYVRSDITNQTFPLFFNVGGSRVPPEETSGIPPHAKFAITVLFPDQFPNPQPPNQSGISADKFLVDFAAFTFVFEYDGQRYERRFSTHEIESLITRFNRATRGRVAPSVSRRAKPSSPVEWDLSGIFTMGTYRGDNTLRFSGFMINGRNTTDQPITRMSGYIRSNITNEKLPIYVTAEGKRVVPEEILGVPPGARIEVSAPFGPDSYDDVTQMLDEPTLLQRFGDATFVVELDGRREEHRFSRDDIERVITKGKRSLYGVAEPRIKEKGK